MRRFFGFLTVLSVVLFPVVPAFAQLTTQTVVGDVPGVVAFVQDPVLPNTFYVVQQTGSILVLQNGEILETPLVDLTDDVLAGGERGLLGLAFAPNTATGWFFVNFTNKDNDGATVVARFTRQAGTPVAVPGSRLDLQWPDGQRIIPQPAGNHNGGHLAFGPDGFLYIGLGDGGGGNDTFGNAQNPNTLLGKMLRIDINVEPGNTKRYRVPASNPFVGLPTFGEIWSFGLRNPWRYSFDNPVLGGTGALIIADVGQGAREEVNYEPAARGGRNYGWPNREGSIPTPVQPPDPPPPPPLPMPLTNPIFDYGRAIGQAVTGGYVYRGSALPPSFRGRYFVADSISGLVGSVGLTISQQTGEASLADAIDHTTEIGGGSIVSFAEDLSGELYLVRQGGPAAVSKIVSNCAVPPAPANLTHSVGAGNLVTLTWGGVPGVPGYLIEVGLSPGTVDLSVPIFGVGTTSVSGVVPAGTYHARVRTGNACGLSPASNQVTVVVP